MSERTHREGHFGELRLVTVDTVLPDLHQTGDTMGFLRALVFMPQQKWEVNDASARLQDKQG